MGRALAATAAAGSPVSLQVSSEAQGGDWPPLGAPHSLANGYQQVPGDVTPEHAHPAGRQCGRRACV